MLTAELQKISPDPMQIYCLPLALLCRLILTQDVGALFSIFIFLYSFVQQRNQQLVLASNKTADLDGNESWNEVVASIPEGIAIKRLGSSKWGYRNVALSLILGATDRKAVDAILDNIERQVMVIARESTETSKKKESLPSVTFGEIGVESEGAIKGGSGLLEKFMTLNQRSVMIEVLIGITTRYFSVYCKVINWEKQQSVIYLIRDAMETHNFEELKRENRTNAAILQGLSHKQRTQVNTILSSLELCKHKLADDKEAVYGVNIALANSNLLLNKYNDLAVCTVGLKVGLFKDQEGAADARLCVVEY